MKDNYISLTGVIFIMLVGMVMSGCAASPQMADSMNYVRQHKGEGTRHSLLGSEAELMDEAAKAATGSIIVREPHAVLVKANAVELSYAFYFYPSRTNGQTDVEVLIASKWFKPELCRQFEKDAFKDYFPLSYINTRLLEEGYDPNVKDGQLLALSTAAFYDSRETARKLINKGANLDLAINGLKEHANNLKENASRISSLLNDPDFRKHYDDLRRSYDASRMSYDKANLAVEMLNGLKKQAKQNEAEKESEAGFKEAFRTYQPAAIKPQMPESARRFMVQAEDAVREKKFDDAADLYKQALSIVPLWPEGRFNRAWVLGETGDYETAVREMKRYLLLVPNAPNARAAQDKIYIWEGKAAEGN